MLVGGSKRYRSVCTVWTLLAQCHVVRNGASFKGILGLLCLAAVHGSRKVQVVCGRYDDVDLIEAHSCVGRFKQEAIEI